VTVSGAPSAASYERPAPPFASQVVEEVLRAFLKAGRAHQLYLPNNPVHAKSIEQLRAAFTALWAETDEITLVVSETTLVWEGAVVLEEREKNGDSLPWTCYKDGVRSLQFARGFEEAEAMQFLDLVQRVRRASPDEDDLLTMLWQGDFVYLRYGYVDLSLDGVASLEPAGLAQDNSPAAAEARAAAARAPAPPGLVSLDDFDSTLYFLDESEIDYLRSAVAAEYAGDLRRNVLAILLDTLETQHEPAVRLEICDILDTLLLHFLSAGQLRSVAYLLGEVGAVAARAQGLDPAVRERLLAFPAGVSEPAALGQLLQSLDEAAEMPNDEELAELFVQLRPSALATLFGWLPRLTRAQLVPLVERAADRLASQHTGELVRVLESNDRAVVMEAMRRAASLRTAAAVPALGRLLQDADPKFRLQAVQALAEIASPGALQSLERAVDDAARDVRVAAVRAVGARTFRPALARVEQAVKGRAVREADLSEKVAFFETFGALCGDGGVALLDGILNGRSLLGRRDDAELRACAALALGRVATPTARAALERAAGEKEVVVRNAVNRAIRGGSE
jgi:hypothetical protein